MHLNLWFVLIACNIFSKESLVWLILSLLNESTKSLLIFINDQSDNLNYCFFGCVILFFNGKSRDFQKLLRYVSKIVTSTFKAGTGGCCSWFLSPLFPDCAGLCGIFLLFSFYVQMIYYLKHYYQHHQFRLYNNFINFLMS